MRKEVGERQFIIPSKRSQQFFRGRKKAHPIQQLQQQAPGDIPRIFFGKKAHQQRRPPLRDARLEGLTCNTF
jgi:hypothetical protein